MRTILLTYRCADSIAYGVARAVQQQYNRNTTRDKKEGLKREQEE